MFYLTKDTFDAVPISMLFVSEIEVVFSTGSLEWYRTIDEKYHVVLIMFPIEFHQK